MLWNVYWHRVKLENVKVTAILLINLFKKNNNKKTDLWVSREKASTTKLLHFHFATVV